MKVFVFYFIINIDLFPINLRCYQPVIKKVFNVIEFIAIEILFQSVATLQKGGKHTSAR